MDGRGRRRFGGVDAGRVQRGGDIPRDHKRHWEVCVVDDQVDSATSGLKPDGVAVFLGHDLERRDRPAFKGCGDSVGQGDCFFAGENGGVDERVIEQDGVSDLGEGRLDDERRRGRTPRRLLLIDL